MNYKTISTLFVGLCITVVGVNAYADDDQATKNENIVVGACMIQKFQENTPPISQATIDKCADADSDAAPKCLGLTNDAYMTDVKFCIAQLVNAKCVSAKMKVALIDYADCGYEKDPVACYKQLGFSADDVAKLSTACQAEVKK